MRDAIVPTIVATLILMCSHLGSSTPGQGVIAIYYRTSWTYPITVNYVPYNESEMTNATMQQWWGPEPAYHSAEWKYVELPTNVATDIYFVNSTGYADDRNGGFWHCEIPGVYVIYNDTVNDTINYYWGGCPGIPPENVVVECSAHGSCNEYTQECDCDNGWTCPACECYEGCEITESTRGIGSSNVTYPEIHTATECCTKCQEAGHNCKAANYNYEEFTCQILTSITRVENFTGLHPFALVYSPLPTPSPAPTTLPVPADNHLVLFVVVGIGAVLLLAVGLLGVRVLTGQQQHDAVLKLLKDKQKESREGRGVFEGKYKVVRILGRGAFGIVYLVQRKFPAPAAAGVPSPSNAAALSSKRAVTPQLGHYPGSSSQLNEPLMTSARMHNASPGQYGATGSPKNSPSLAPCPLNASNSAVLPPVAPGAASGPPASPKVSTLSSVPKSTPQSSATLLQQVQQQELFAMKVIHCNNEEELGTAFSEFQSLRRLQGHENIVSVVDMFMTWEADTPGFNLPPNPGSNGSIVSADSRSGSLNDSSDDEGAASNKSSHQQPPPTRYLCIVMEYMDEGTLEKGMKEDAAHFARPSVIMSVLRQVIAGIAFSHRKNIIHRDLKPGNVLLSNERSRAVLTDFGLARDLDQSINEKCGAGTLPFLAPEQMDHRVSKKSDIWSIACIGVAMAIAQRTAAPRAMFLLRSESDFEDMVRRDVEGLPQWLQDLLIRMLQAVPLDRPTAEECLAEFDANYDPSQPMLASPSEMPAASREVSDILILPTSAVVSTPAGVMPMQRVGSSVGGSPAGSPPLPHPIITVEADAT